MKWNMIFKVGVDAAMTAALLLLMAYSLVGEAVHEWIGVAMFFMFAAHHILNRKWIKNSLKGKYTPLRIWKSALVAAVLVCMAGSMVSGIIVSRHVFAFMDIYRGRTWAGPMHLICAYWGLVMMSLHLGAHWSMIIGMAKKMLPNASASVGSAAGAWLLRLPAAAIAAYGAFAFVKRDIWSYMTLKNEFVFFDFQEPRIFFFIDYIAVMGLFVFIGHYITVVIRRNNVRRTAA